MASDRLNLWAGLKYFNPTKVHIEAHRQGFRHQLGGRPNVSQHFSKAEAKALVESLDGAIFAHGLRSVLPVRGVCIAEYEALDHDFILRFGPREAPFYCPLQLKVVVSEMINNVLRVDDLLRSLSKYKQAGDLVVAVKVDRHDVDPTVLDIPKLDVGAL